MKKFYEDETYIRMCDKAIEIIPYVSPTISLPKEALFYYEDNHTLYYMGERLFPLYRQDQLQDILKNYNYHTGYISKGKDKKGDFYLGYENYYLQEPPKSPEDVKLRGESIEVLLLKMIMDIEYNKTWNGEDWV